MDPRIYGAFPVNGPPGTVGPQGPQGPQGPRGPRTPGGTPATTGPGADFRNILQKQVDREKLKFSLHAQERLAGRSRPLGPEDLAKLNEAVDKASARGAKESLILMRDMAFVVSVKNRTVITAVDGERMKDNVFTNIDSAVIV
ncbi:MAG: TIGR02530 family flagellar biosynthesis protein [Bacillota bacterium]